MKNITKTTLLLLSPLAFISCNQETAEVESNPPAIAETTTAAAYPLEVCIVSGEELGSMGDPITIVHEEQEIKFCCDSCPPKFNEDPAKFVAKLDTASD